MNGGAWLADTIADVLADLTKTSPAERQLDEGQDQNAASESSTTSLEQERVP